jgi:hypothetical protein
LAAFLFEQIIAIFQSLPKIRDSFILLFGDPGIEIARNAP